MDHSHNAKLFNLIQVQFEPNAFFSLLSARLLLPSCCVMKRDSFPLCYFIPAVSNC